jgi:hypothetical protein
MKAIHIIIDPYLKMHGVGLDADNGKKVNRKARISE